MPDTYKTSYEWKVNFHDQDGDIEDVCHTENIEELNNLLDTDETISVELVKRKWKVEDVSQPNEWGYLKREWNFYVDWEKMSLKDDQGTTPPEKFQKEVKKFKKPNHAI